MNIVGPVTITLPDRCFEDGGRIEMSDEPALTIEPGPDGRRILRQSTGGWADVVSLGATAATRLADLISNPGPPNEALVQAMQRRR